MDTPKASQAAQIDPSDPALLRLYQIAFCSGAASIISSALGMQSRHAQALDLLVADAWRRIEGDPVAMLVVTSSIESALSAGPDAQVVMGAPMEVFGR